MFDTEEKMIECFKKQAPVFIKGVLGISRKRTVILEEYDCQNGIADLVLGVLPASAKAFKHRPALRPEWARILNSIPLRTEFTMDEFVILSRLPKKQAKQCLSVYCEAGFFRKTQDDIFSKKANYKPFLRKVISLEAKLKNWKRALMQAYRYKSFSDYSFVLLDDTRSAIPKQCLDIFKRYNIGLVTMTSQELFFHFIPEETRYREYSRYRLNETILSSLFESNSLQIV